MLAASKAAEDASLEEELGDVPDDFLDPIQCTLMRDPVILPTSNTTMDRWGEGWRAMCSCIVAEPAPAQCTLLWQDIMQQHRSLRVCQQQCCCGACRRHLLL